MIIDKKLLLIFLLALFLRLFFLGSVPHGFHNDEVDVGYVGKFIILHGRDPAGNFLPLVFNKFEDFRPTGLFYLAGISQLIFGSNEFAVRFPTALFGALTVLPVFFLARELFGHSNFKDSRSVRHLKKPFDQVLPKTRHLLSGLTYASARRRLRRNLNHWFGLASSYFLKWLPLLLRSQQVESDVKGQWSDVSAQTVALFAALFLAILPWHIVLSRAGHEAIVGYFLIIWGLYYLVKFLNDKNKKFLVFSFLLLVSSYLFYHGTRLIVPLILLSFLPLFRSKVILKLSAVFVILTLLIVLTPYGKGRISQLIFYKNPGTLRKIAELPFADKGSIKSARIFHNKPVVYTREAISNYLQYFSPDFLLLRGGSPERYYVPEVGVVYILLGVFLFFGLIESFRGVKTRLLVLIWLFISPLPAVLTYEDIPSVTRASFMMFPLVLISTWGFCYLMSVFKGRFLKGVFLVFSLAILLAEIAFFYHQYFFHQKVYKGILRDDGAKEIVQYIAHQKGNYDLVVAPYGPNLPFDYLFYSNVFDRSIKVDIADRNTGFQYGNALFLRDGCPSHRADHFLGKNVLFVDEANCTVKPKKQEVLQVTRADLTVAFRAYVESEK